MDRKPPRYEHLPETTGYPHVSNKIKHLQHLLIKTWNCYTPIQSSQILVGDAYADDLPSHCQNLSDELVRKSDDNIENTALLQGEWSWHPRMSKRLGLFRLVQMPGSHEVIFSNPIGLAEKIIELGRD